MKSSTVHIDGQLYFWTAFGIAALGFLGTEEAYKYASPVILFWLKFGITATLGGFNGLKAYRSMTFGRFVQQEQAKEDTAPTEPPKTP